MTIGDDLSYKIGGAVPVWIVAVGLSGGYLIVERKRKAAASAAALATAAAMASPAPDNATVATDSTGFPQMGFPAIDPNIGASATIDPATGLPYNQEATSFPAGIAPAGLPAPVSNGQWGTIAEDFLISKGDDPTAVMQAIANFLNGSPLSTTDQAFVNLATSQLGTPPQPLVPGTGPGSSGGVAGAVSYSSLPMTRIGSGYLYGSSGTAGSTTVYGIGGPSAGIYEWINAPSTLGALTSGGSAVYFSPVPGVFTQATGKEQPGTPAYYKVA